MSNDQDLKNFKKNLDTNKDDQDFYVNSEVTEDESDSSDTEILKHDELFVAPKNSSKINSVLLQQLFKQQSVILNAQRTIYKLKNDLNKEELKMRYLKLDLNNSQLHSEELENQLIDTKLELYVSKSESYMYRGMSLLYLVYTIGSYFL